MFDPTHTYMLTHAIDGCTSLADVTLGGLAHGHGEEEFNQFREGSRDITFDTDESWQTDHEDNRTLHEGSDNPALDALWAALGEEANRRGWCNEYDDFASAHGGPARPPRRFDYTLGLRMNLDINMEEVESPRDTWEDFTTRERRDLITASIERRIRRTEDNYGVTLSDEARNALTREFGRYVGVALAD